MFQKTQTWSFDLKTPRQEMALLSVFCPHLTFRSTVAKVQVLKKGERGKFGKESMTIQYWRNGEKFWQISFCVTWYTCSCLKDFKLLSTICFTKHKQRTCALSHSNVRKNFHFLCKFFILRAPNINVVIDILVGPQKCAFWFCKLEPSDGKQR